MTPPRNGEPVPRRDRSQSDATSPRERPFAHPYLHACETTEARQQGAGRHLHQAGVTGKGSALASLTDEEHGTVTAFIKSGKAGRAGGPQRVIFRRAGLSRRRRAPPGGVPPRRLHGPGRHGGGQDSRAPLQAGEAADLEEETGGGVAAAASAEEPSGEEPPVEVPSCRSAAPAEEPRRPERLPIEELRPKTDMRLPEEMRPLKDLRRIEEPKRADDKDREEKDARETGGRRSSWRRCRRRAGRRCSGSRPSLPRKSPTSSSPKTPSAPARRARSRFPSTFASTSRSGAAEAAKTTARGKPPPGEAAPPAVGRRCRSAANVPAAPAVPPWRKKRKRARSLWAAASSGN